MEVFLKKEKMPSYTITEMSYIISNTNMSGNNSWKKNL